MKDTVKPKTAKLYAKGNRLPVPASINGAHFLYQAKSPVFDRKDEELVSAAVVAFISERGLNPSQIDVVSPSDLANPLAAAALDRMRSSFQAALQTEDVPSLLVCEWAAPHVDDCYEGVAFASYVLHTGPHPYILQTMATHVTLHPAPHQGVQTNTRLLAKGQTVVFDPTTPHLAMPARPHQGQLLVLLQAELPDDSEEARKALLSLLPPIRGDLDNTAVFEGVF